MNNRNQVILAIDQGTTSSRTIALNSKGDVIASNQKEFAQIFPQKGWVEHDPQEILESQLDTLKEVCNNVESHQIVSIGITNQRETTILWDRVTGVPVYNAIVWQDQRTSGYCQSLSAHKSLVKAKTGLVIDSYFSASKIRWILDHIENGQERAEKGELCFGTVDTWLLWNFTGQRCHKTDFSNASRTLLFNIQTLEWDNELLEIFNIPRAILPQACHTIHEFGSLEIGGNEIPINALVGDQQGALFGQACFKKGMAKNTYGTGCFMLMNTGESSIESNHGLLATIAWGDGDSVTYALEGSVFVAGSAIQWLRDGLKLIDAAPDSEYYATKAASKDGVYVVPAFAGLGAPYWDMDARGAIFGLTRDTGKDHIIKATLESIAYQCKDVLTAMNQDSGIDMLKLSVDGGASANDLLMQFQSDLLQIEVERPKMVESTALGAAYLAGIGCGLWTKSEIVDFRSIDEVFQPNMTKDEMKRLYHGWKKAVNRTKNWMDD